MNTIASIMAMQPCGPGKVWLKQFRSIHTAWECVDRPEWLLWYLHKSGRLTVGFLAEFAARCRAPVPAGESKAVLDILAEKMTEAKDDIVLVGQWTIETSLVAIDFAARSKRADVEQIRQCEVIRDMFPNPF